MARTVVSEDLELDPEQLALLKNWEMPFGRYAGRKLIDLPEPYVVWFHREGVPRGKLGELLELLYVVKLNGLEPLIRAIPDPER